MNTDHLMLAEHKTKEELVLDALRDAIVSGELSPGQHLQPSELAARLGTSETPVRGALRQLEAEGLVSRVAYKGAFVNHFSTSDFDEIYAMRKLLEGFVSRRAVEKMVAESAIEETARSLRRVLGEMEVALEGGEYGELVRKNQEFHLSLYERANCPRFYQVITQLLRSFPIEPLWRVPQRAAIFLEQHTEIVRAVESGDPELVGQLVTSHLESSRAQITAHLHGTTGD